MSNVKVRGVVERIHFDPKDELRGLLVVLRPDDECKDIRFFELTLGKSMMREQNTQLRLTQPGDLLQMTLQPGFSGCHELREFENLSLKRYLAACPTYPG
ncbi:hypothetical protein D3C71_25640 [compost metagenome]